MASTIGIKIANGEFYSIIEENAAIKKRLVLTTVHDNQRSVQIDLYKSYTKTMADALYIGSLVVEKLQPRPKGTPSIELVISSTADGEISADAADIDSTAPRHYLSVSLKSLSDEHAADEIPDFELEDNDSPPEGLYEKAEEKRQEDEKKPFPVLIAVVAGLLIVLVCLLLWFFLLRAKPESDYKPGATPAAPAEEVIEAPKSQTTQESAPVSPAKAKPAPKPAESVKAETPKPAAEPAKPAPQPAKVVQAPKTAPKAAAPVNRSRAPVASYKVPSTIPKNGAPYKIRWGDTLWDIAAAFYRNPWQYHRIARFNNIKNPNLIISGRTIRIPPLK